MKSLLITGGAGFIGANFSNYWLRKYPEDRVIVLDCLSYAGKADYLKNNMDNPQFEFIKADILNGRLVKTVLKEKKVDTIVHFAAESHVDRSIDYPEKFVSTNIVGTHTLLMAAAEIWLQNGKTPHRFHHVSTDEVYGSLQPQDPESSETTPYAPNSPYAASKAASDHLVNAYHRTYGLNITISNCSNNFGPFQFAEKLIPKTITDILHGRPITVYGNGMNIRDWLYVEDHCYGIDLILQKGEIGETYNIGANNEIANLDLVNIICRSMDKKFEMKKGLKEEFPLSPGSKGERSETLIEFVKDRPGHDWRYALCVDKIKKDLGFSPLHVFSKSLDQTIDWYIYHESVNQ